ncbi:MAG: hypothetical protein KGH86_04005 [Thaumarchaeota archaeon]|nr:hypothetical protein [Nitrososphaerota archaeon]MDE1875976.1 hypothetical protein [Nitrososphaerota archaeon]
MARIKIKYGQNEIEIESKDFYIDNESVEQVICNLASFVKDSTNNNVQYEYSYDQSLPQTTGLLNSLNDAEVHEPEFSTPTFIDKDQIKGKMQVLIEDSFFDQARTVSEVVAQLREYGWSTIPLDVSKTLATMAFSHELQKDLREKRSYYSKVKLLEVN